MRTGAAIALVVVSLIILVGCVHESEPTLDEIVAEAIAANITIDPHVIDELKNKSTVEVRVKLQPEIFTPPSIEGDISISARGKWVREKINELHEKVIPTLSESDFTLESKHKYNPLFFGEVTVSGLRKLVNNPNVESIEKSSVQEEIVWIGGLIEAEEMEMPEEGIDLEETPLPSEKFNEWLSETQARHGFDHPWISCIFNNTCMGTFRIYPDLDCEENFTTVNKALNKYLGTDYMIFWDHCYVYISTRDPYKIKGLIDLPFILEVSIPIVDTDWQFGDEIYYCEDDDDCISIEPGCCSCGNSGTAIAINAEYEEDYNYYLSQRCKNTACEAMLSGHISCFSDPKCVDNSCILVPNKEKVCTLLPWRNCKEWMPRAQWDEVKEVGISCREISEFCE